MLHITNSTRRPRNIPYGTIRYTKNASHIMSLYANTKLKVNVLDINEDKLTKREYYDKVGPINGAHWLVVDHIPIPYLMTRVVRTLLL